MSLVTLSTALLLSGVLLTSGGSLFEPTEDDIALYGLSEDITVTDTVYPDYAISSDGELLTGEAVRPEEDSTEEDDAEDTLETVSGGDADVVMLSQSQTMLADAVALQNSVNVSVADAYLTSSIVECFSRVVDGLPSYYKYAAYRANSSDQSEGYLIFGSDAKVDGDYLLFNEGCQIGHYYRVAYQNGYNTYYEYKYDVTTLSASSYRIPYKSGQLVYTNMVMGYPTLSEYTESHWMGLVVPAVVAVLCLVFVLRRRK